MAPFTSSNRLHLQLDLGDRRISAEITVTAVIRHFGALDAPASWVRVFHVHRDEIESVVMSHLQAGMAEPIQLDTQHFGVAKPWWAAA